jgi:hypothetical protein
VRLLHSLARTHAFGDPDLVSHAGLVPVAALAQPAGLADLAAGHVRPGGDCGVNAHLFPVWRYHAVFTDSPFELIQAEGQHRGHAVVKQVFADITSSPLAHMPSPVFTRKCCLACHRGHGP